MAVIVTEYDVMAYGMALAIAAGALAVLVWAWQRFQRRKH